MSVFLTDCSLVRQAIGKLTLTGEVDFKLCYEANSVKDKGLPLPLIPYLQKQNELVVSCMLGGAEVGGRGKKQNGDVQ